MRIERVIHCVDAHAEGEQSRVVVGGVLPPPGDTVLAQMRHLREHGEALRRLLLYEPRGSAPLSADLVVPPCRPEADAGFVIMESSSYEGMSGSNAMCTAAVLVETGMLPPGRMVLEAPAGLVRAEVADAPGGGRLVTIENVPSFALALDVEVTVPEVGALRVDVAYGGAFCAFVDAAPLGFAIVPEEARALADLGERTRVALLDQVPISHPTEPALAHLSFVVFTAAPRAGGDARNATVVAPGRLDRCPTGTATSARLAVLAARGERGPGDELVNESVLSTTFTGRILRHTRAGEHDAIVPTVAGRVFVTGFHQLVRTPGDPLGEGIRLPDTWGAAAAGEGLLNA